ncbi:MAG: sigma-70 family RNA polymerase sigma factor [Acidimicrobiia bacterium]|nr:sigma-70 family RNA polymerase sigma factor [Acidimicrobiia bacterium]
MARTGGDASFEAAYPELFARAATLAYRLVGERTAAEDVAAEALARTYAHWGRVSTLPYRDGWVLRVATNLAIDAVRRRPPSPATTAPLDAAEATTIRLALVAALQSLPKRQRQAVSLRYLSGLREEEVATALGVSASTASTHVRRGLDTLRRYLGDGFGEELADGRA